MSKPVQYNENVIDRTPITDKRAANRKPSMFKVLFLNDDLTTMQFVIEMLEKHFNHTYDDAHSIMLQVHRTGIAVAGVYPLDVADTKAMAVIEEARFNKFPLQTAVDHV